MSRFTTKIPPFLLSRTAKNMYFWLFMLLTKMLGTSYTLPAATYYSLVVFNLLFFIVPCTLNNYVLVPRLLRAKKYAGYAVACLGMVFCFAFIYTLWLKYLGVLLPGIKIFDVSIVSSPMSSDIDLVSTLEEMRTIFFILLMYVFCFTGMWYINDYARNEKRTEEALKKQLETELHFLKSQINPHFLFNTLNNLYGLSLKNSEQTPETILRLSSILRYILYESNSEFISFEKEKEMMQAYIDIEMLRLPDTGNLQFSIMADRPCSIPPLLWLPVLENVFKHGANVIDDDYFIDFRFALHENTLSIYSKNKSKPGTSKSGAEKAGGIGLTNLRKRLGLLYPGKHSIFLTPEADGGNFFITNVQITLQ